MPVPSSIRGSCNVSPRFGMRLIQHQHDLVAGFDTALSWAVVALLDFGGGLI